MSLTPVVVLRHAAVIGSTEGKDGFRTFINYINATNHGILDPVENVEHIKLVFSLGSHLLEDISCHTSIELLVHSEVVQELGWFPKFVAALLDLSL